MRAEMAESLVLRYWNSFLQISSGKRISFNEVGPVYVTYNKHAGMNRWKEALFTDGKPGLILLRGVGFSQLSFLHSISQKKASTEHTHTHTFCQLTYWLISFKAAFSFLS